jgi:hypothetical protein
MNSNTGDQSRQDLEARIDRILREPEVRTVNIEPKQPEAAKTQPAVMPNHETRVEEIEVKKEGSAKQISVYVKTMTDALFQALRASLAWVQSLARGAREKRGPKTRGSLGKWIAKFRKLSGNRVKKPLAFVLGGIGVTVAVLLTVLLNLSYVTVSNGIETTLGASENRTVLTLKSSGANQGDLIVASLGLDNESNEDILVIGTVFSKNDQTYALYDGEVIWQVTSEQIRGIVLFAEATQTP